MRESYERPLDEETTYTGNGTQIEETVETTIEAESKPKTSLADLMDEYNDEKKDDTDVSKVMSGSFTVEGLKETGNEVVSRLQSIYGFVNNGEKKGFFAEKTGKALAIIDPNEKWISKWIDKTGENLEKEEIKQKEVSVMATEVKDLIESKRQEVMKGIESARVVQASLIEKIEKYKSIKEKAVQIYELAEVNTKEWLDAGYLVAMVSGTLTNMENDLKNILNPLIAVAGATVNNIQVKLPTLENLLQSKSGYKVFQQQLEDLNGMSSTAFDMINDINDMMIKDINGTVLESIKQLGDTGFDVNKIKKNALESEKQNKAINDTMSKVVDKIHKDANDLLNVHNQLDYNRKENQHTLIENYSKPLQPKDD